MPYDYFTDIQVTFPDYDPGSCPGQYSGTQILPTDPGGIYYSLFPTLYAGYREQRDLLGNIYYEWQYFEPWNGQFIIKVKVWPDYVAGGPPGNVGKTTISVANGASGEWRGLFNAVDSMFPWSGELDASTGNSGAIGVGLIGEFAGGEPPTGEDSPTWISNPPQTVYRPEDYNPDLGWDEAGRAWTPTARGGGRYRQQFIAIGEEGEIYYGDAG